MNKLHNSIKKIKIEYIISIIQEKLLILQQISIKNFFFGTRLYITLCIILYLNKTDTLYIFLNIFKNTYIYQKYLYISKVNENECYNLRII